MGDAPSQFVQNGWLGFSIPDILDQPGLKVPPECPFPSAFAGGVFFLTQNSEGRILLSHPGFSPGLLGICHNAKKGCFAVGNTDV